MSVRVDEGQQGVGLPQDLVGRGVGPQLAAEGADLVFEASVVVVGVLEFVENLLALVEDLKAGGDVAEFAKAMLFFEQWGQGVLEVAGGDEVGGSSSGAILAAVGVE